EPHSGTCMYGRETVCIAGVDEVGRGCLVGPVVAAVVILGPDAGVEGLKDSKRLSPGRREALAALIRERAVSWAIGRAEPSEIDRLNILQASLLAMRRAFSALDRLPDHVLVDGSHYPDIPCPGNAIVGGDALVPEISAASILAKVARDSEMQILDALYPGYGFALHKGYPTAYHKSRLRELGPTPLHRRSFAPVRSLLADDLSMSSAVSRNAVRKP
ncbi:MAG: ribonuclease, partial [Proteobacteria bacterium]|nr:ribonuclease [Pseudomonadota bacterium]